MVRKNFTVSETDKATKQIIDGLLWYELPQVSHAKCGDVWQRRVTLSSSGDPAARTLMHRPRLTCDGRGASPPPSPFLCLSLFVTEYQ